MRLFLLIFMVFISTLSTDAQTFDATEFHLISFKRNDTIFLKKSHLPFNGFIESNNATTLYENGIASVDTPFSKTDNRFFWASMIFSLEKDTFTIDSRYSVTPAPFFNKKIFYLRSVGRSKLINIDTLKAHNYSEIKIPDNSYYALYEKSKRCPISNHRDSIILLIYGKPSKEGLKWIKEGKAKIGYGIGYSDAMYLCQRHNFEF